MPKKPNKEFHYWHKEEGLKILKAAAITTLHRCKDHSNFVEVGDLISEGWLKSFRYIKEDKQLKWQPIHSRQAMQKARLRLLNPHRLKERQIYFHSLKIDVVEPSLFDGEDMMKELLLCCKTVRDKTIVLMKAQGETNKNIGHRLGISGQWVSDLLKKIKERYDVRIRKYH